MYLRRVLVRVTAVALCVTSPTAFAALVDQGDTTLDTDTNLLWLDTRFSVGNSPQGILNGTDTHNLLAEGWSLATRAQIQTFFTNAGISPIGVGTSGNYMPAKTVVSLLGETYFLDPDPAGNTTHGIFAFTADGIDPQNLYTASIYYADPIQIGATDLPTFFTLPWEIPVASWLVKSAAVPEPATFALLGAALACLGFFRRRKLH